MYNRTLYNRTPYNRSELYIFEWLASAIAEAGTVNANLLIIRHLDGSAEAVTEVSGAVIRVFLPEVAANATAEAIGEFVLRLFFTTDVYAEATATGTGVSTYGSISLTVAGVNMQAGDELIIDTEHMTVTLNGVNIIDKITDSSVFFKLMSGVNQLIIEGSSAADIRVLYKDRWL